MHTYSSTHAPTISRFIKPIHPWSTGLGYSMYRLILILTVAMETHLWLTAPIKPNANRIGSCWHSHQISVSLRFISHYDETPLPEFQQHPMNIDCDRCWNWRGSISLLLPAWLLELGHRQSKCKFIYRNPSVLLAAYDAVILNCVTCNYRPYVATEVTCQNKEADLRHTRV